jgi:hypothetical protein
MRVDRQILTRFLKLQPELRFRHVPAEQWEHARLQLELARNVYLAVRIAKSSLRVFSPTEGAPCPRGAEESLLLDADLENLEADETWAKRLSQYSPEIVGGLLP